MGRFKNKYNPRSALDEVFKSIGERNAERSFLKQVENGLIQDKKAGVECIDNRNGSKIWFFQFLRYLLFIPLSVAGSIILSMAARFVMYYLLHTREKSWLWLVDEWIAYYFGQLILGFSFVAIGCLVIPTKKKKHIAILLSIISTVANVFICYVKKEQGFVPIIGGGIVTLLGIAVALAAACQYDKE